MPQREPAVSCCQEGTIRRRALFLTLTLAAGCVSSALPGRERGPAATLEDTYWKLLEVGGEPVRVPQDAREPNLRLNSLEKRVRGDTGCNSFSGAYEQGGDSLRLGPLATTLRACLDPRINQQESAYLKALEETRTWRVAGDTLLLAGKAGPVARFVAVYLR